MARSSGAIRECEYALRRRDWRLMQGNERESRCFGATQSKIRNVARKRGRLGKSGVDTARVTRQEQTDLVCIVRLGVVPAPWLIVPAHSTGEPHWGFTAPWGTCTRAWAALILYSVTYLPRQPAVYLRRHRGENSADGSSRGFANDASHRLLVLSLSDHDPSAKPSVWKHQGSEAAPEAAARGMKDKRDVSRQRDANRTATPGPLATYSACYGPCMRTPRLPTSTSSNRILTWRRTGATLDGW